MDYLPPKDWILNFLLLQAIKTNLKPPENILEESLEAADLGEKNIIFPPKQATPQYLI